MKPRLDLERVSRGTAARLGRKQQGRYFGHAEAGQSIVRVSTAARPARAADHGYESVTVFGAGVFELREAFGGNAWRVVYAVKMRNAVYVLHAFIKKATSGKALAKRDVDTIVARLKRAQRMDEENDRK